MRVLVYKRTHNGDPDSNGCFGACDCMGAVRDREFDAVIGVGGIGFEPKAHGIDGKVNWIGIGPYKTAVPNKRGQEVTFDHFLDYRTDGPDFQDLAPLLAERMYSGNNARVLMVDGRSEPEHREAMAILELAKDAPPSLSRVAEENGACGLWAFPVRTEMSNENRFKG